MDKQARYDELYLRLDALCAGETDAIALMATIACELYHAFPAVQWAGFYRNIGHDTLKVGPYQGTHGCLTIPFSQGVCGHCARERTIITVPDVTTLPYHIACSATTRSEIVVPILLADGTLLAVLDLDSDTPAAFDAVDERNLTRITAYFTG